MPLFTHEVIYDCILVPSLAVDFWLIIMSPFGLNAFDCAVNCCHPYIYSKDLFVLALGSYMLCFCIMVIESFVYIVVSAGLSPNNLIFGCTVLYPLLPSLPLNCRAGLASDH